MENIEMSKNMWNWVDSECNTITRKKFSTLNDKNINMLTAKIADLPFDSIKSAQYKSIDSAKNAM